MNDACVLLGKPNVYGSIFRFEGQATIFAYEGGPCYRCLYPRAATSRPVPSCAEGWRIGHSARHHRIDQATETVKLILGIGESLVGRLLLYDALGTEVPRTEAAQESRECPVCGEHPTVHQADRLLSIPAGCHRPRPRPPSRRRK